MKDKLVDPRAGTSEKLRARARALARPPARGAAAGAALDLLEIRLAGESYAVESRFVREVHVLKHLTPLPCTPSFLLGVVNLRGRVVPVLDLRKFFDLPVAGLSDLHRVVVVEGGNMEIGLLADVIVGTRAISTDDLQSSLTTLTGIRGDYLKAVAPGPLVVLDAERILADPKIVVNEEVED